MRGPKSASAQRKPSLGLPDPHELAARLEGGVPSEMLEPIKCDAPGPNSTAISPSMPAALARLAELASLRAAIAQEEAQMLSALAGIGEMHLAGCAAQSVTSTVQRRPPLSAPPASELLDKQGVATLLNCDPRTVRRLELEGELPAPVLVGGLKRWRRADLDAWLERQHAAAKPGRSDR